MQGFSVTGWRRWWRLGAVVALTAASGCDAEERDFDERTDDEVDAGDRSGSDASALGSLSGSGGGAGGSTLPPGQPGVDGGNPQGAGGGAAGSGVTPGAGGSGASSGAAGSDPAGPGGSDGGQGGGNGGAPALSTCASDPCVFGICANNGDSFVCACLPGYTGETCSETLVSCEDAECGHGACVEGPEGPSCVCEDGWTGATCEVDRDECQDATCLNGSECIDDVGSFSCRCAAGYSGESCEINDDDCSPNPCDNGAACIDGVNSFVCDCPSGFNGDTCEVAFSVCTPTACENGGTCTDTAGGPVCECANGFSGTTCQINDDDCSPNPCQNGATCTDGVAAFTCSCAAGWSGTTCTTNIDDCASDPCLNGGTCVDLVAGFSCDCAAGFSGTRCQTNTNDCSPNPCQNGGTCQDGANTFTCTCATGFSGSTCAVNIDDCAPNPCQNGGTCQDGVNAYTCQCPQGFSGNQCQTNVNDCSPNPCQNGGTCQDGVNAYTCQCDGYLGSTCQTPMFETVAAPAGYEYCSVNGLSGTGAYMAVSCLMSFMHTFRWSPSSGLQEIAFPANTLTMTGAGIDSTGANVFGYGSVATSGADLGSPFKWSAAGGVVWYAPYEAQQSTFATDVSADGSKVLGAQSSGGRILLWSSQAAPTPYEPNPGDDVSRSGRISGNGLVVIGNSYDSTNNVTDLVRWTGPTTRQPISITGNSFLIYDINFDGSVAVGYSDGYAGQAFVWRSTSGITQLPTLGSGACSATGISDNGARIVGTCNDGTAYVAVLWENGTVQRVSTLLTNAGAELGGDPLSGGFVYISADGKTLAGGYGLGLWVGRLAQ